MEVVSSEGAQNDEGLHVAEIARRVGSSGDEMMLVLFRTPIVAVGL
jgi:hypothetical protein